MAENDNIYIYSILWVNVMNFFLILNNKKDTGFETAAKIVGFLTGMDECSCVYIPKETFDICGGEIPQILKNTGARSVPKDECLNLCDIAVVIGGDGTILKAAKLLYGKNIPIIGINLGKVGYMAELEVGECELMSALLPGSDVKSEVHIDERMMLSCSVVRNGKTVFSTVCLNEAVVAKGDIARMIDLRMCLNGDVIAEYQCDGIIAATPTGSTAYSMSAGGAVIDPKIECISVIPLCPYLCINSSPIIFSKDSEIEIFYSSSRENSAYLSTDGEEGFLLCDKDRIIVCAAEHTTKLLRFKKTDFYKLLNTKLTNRLSELADRT